MKKYLNEKLECNRAGRSNCLPKTQDSAKIKNMKY